MSDTRKYKDKELFPIAYELSLELNTLMNKFDK